MRKKSKTNKLKHGIDFREAQELWKDRDKITLLVSGVTEQRFLVVGELKSKIWTVVITYRKMNIRIMSARRARDYEKEAYQKNKRKEI